MKLDNVTILDLLAAVIFVALLIAYVVLSLNNRPVGTVESMLLLGGGSLIRGVLPTAATTTLGGATTTQTTTAAPASPIITTGQPTT